MKSIIFDIETGALPQDEIAHMCPEFEAPSNYKDVEKIQAYIEAKRLEWMDRAALSPTTGRVLAIGFISEDEIHVLSEGGEAEVIRDFWAAISNQEVIINRLVGFNCKSFDLPFLIRRSWKLGVKIPKTLIEQRYFSESVIDIMDVWRCGNRDQTISLNDLAKFLGVGEKNGDGKDFQKLWETDQMTAIEYIENDLLLTKRCAQKLNII